jgi:signal peptidase I
VPSTAAPTSRARQILARFELPILILLAVAVAVALKTFVIQPFYIPSESMERTLHGCTGCAGDRILVFKPVYSFHDPRPGDIVVFKAPADWEPEGEVAPTSSNPLLHAAQWFGQLVGFIPPSERDLVKRVVAIGGQTIKCCDLQGNVQVADNGRDFRSLNEPYVYQNFDLGNRAFGPVTIPTGRLWVMGDHRDNSADSLFHLRQDGQGSPIESTVAVGSVIGKAIVIAWPPSRWRTLGTPATFSAFGLVGARGIGPAVAFAGAAPVLYSRARRHRLGRRRRN